MTSRGSTPGLEVPGVGRRLAAAAVDGAVVGVAMLVTFPIVGLLDVISRAPATEEAGHEVTNRPLYFVARLLLAVPLVAYLTWFRASGQTIGMNTASIRLVREDGGEPGLRRAAARTSVTLVVAAAAFVVWVKRFGREPDALTAYRELYWTPAERTVAVASTVVAVAAASAVFALLDAQRRTLLDRVFRLVHVEDSGDAERATAFDQWLRRRG